MVRNTRPPREPEGITIWVSVRLALAPSPLEYAISAGDIDLIRLLLDHAAPLTDPAVVTVSLCRAIHHGQAAMLSLLLASGVSPLPPDALSAPLALTARYGQTDGLRLLLDAGRRFPTVPWPLRYSGASARGQVSGRGGGQH